MSIDSIQRFGHLFFSDIVGYSQMTANHETHTLNLLNEHNIILKKCITNYNGKIIKHIGDAIFAEFPKSRDALNASIEIQTELKDRNEMLPNDDQIIIRIGLHIGNVIEKSGDLFGNDVNLCSRIEGVAVPGGIACSSEMIKDENDLFTRSYGFVKLKNIPKPQKITRVYCNEDEYRSHSDEKLNKLLINRGVSIVKTDEVPIAFKTLAFTYPDNLGKSKHDFFCYEFIKTLIEDSNKVESLRVSSLNEIMKYKNSSNDIPILSTKLTAEYISHLTLHPFKNNFKVNIEITSVNTLEKIYDKSFSGEINEIRIISGKIIIDISRNLNLEVTDDLKKILHQNLGVNNDAYLLFLEGKSNAEHISSVNDLEKSKNLIKNALDIDSSFPEAYASLGYTYLLLGEYEDAEEMLEEGLELAENTKDPEILSRVDNYMGILYKTTGNIKKSIKFFENALKYQRQVGDRYIQAHIYNNMSQCYGILGENEKCITLAIRAQKIYSDFEDDEKLASSYGMLANAYKNKGDINMSIKYYSKAKLIFFKEKMYYRYAQSLIIQSEAYLLANQNDYAWKNLNESMIYAKNFNNPIMNGRISFVMAEAHYNQSELSDAFNHIEDSIDIFQDLNNKLMLSKAYAIKTDILIQQRDMDSSKKSLEKLKKYSRRLNIKSLDKKISILESKIKENS